MTSQGLALLAATYSDSEGEESIVDEPTQTVLVRPMTNIENSKSASATSSSSSSTHWLVSSVDDIIMSDEELPSPTAEDQYDMRFLSMETDTAVMSRSDPDELQNGVTIPPEPTGKCSEELQERIAKYYDQMLNDGLDMNKVIQNNKSFRNPNLYDKLVEYCNINESDTNYPPEIYDPLKWGKESYYDELSRVQELEMTRRENENFLKNSKLYVFPGAVKKPESAKCSQKRSSRRDQRTSNVAPKPNKKQPRLEQRPITTNVNGAKSTVAFGSLPKKPKLTRKHEFR
ncbi:unnamed protein product [Diatraea saccharalis]|uniref:SAP30-binding protein n=1 Tax=Diatraea saccharalis TaxID=40085 RepID=A0A9N9R4Q9_9NEOP|nr:unnamed protein product [Diatraea saccharalis]